MACEREETRHNMHEEIGMERCVLCGKEIIDYGHNASLFADGRCCEKYNALVIKARLERFVEELGNIAFNIPLINGKSIAV